MTYESIWENIAPYAVLFGASIVTGLIGWVAITIPQTKWYAQQPWVVRKAIDVALQLAVRRLQPQAKTLRDSNFGKIQSQDADMLHMAAVQDAMETIRLNSPNVAKAIPTKVLEARIAVAVPKVVEQIKAAEKKEKQKRRTGGTSPGARR